MATKKIPASTIKHVQNAPGLTASQRASLKQSPAEKKARMASAQGRMGTLVSNFAKRQRGEKTPTGVGRPAAGSAGKGRVGKDYGGRGQAFEFLSGKHDAQLRKMAGTAFKRSPYYKRKTSRSPTRASSRSGGR